MCGVGWEEGVEIIAKCVVCAYPEPLVRWRVVLGI